MSDSTKIAPDRGIMAPIAGDLNRVAPEELPTALPPMPAELDPSRTEPPF